LLQTLASALKAHIRDIDTSARIGGDELAAVLPVTGQGGAEAFIEYLSERLTHHRVAPRRLGVSAGIAISPEIAEDAMELMRRADQAIYRMKRGSRTP